MSMNLKEHKKIKALRQFFDITVAVFEMQHSVSKAFGYVGNKSYMHLLHLSAKEEINREKPSFEKMDRLLAIMEGEAKNV